jgi:hypothetical protein
MNLPPLPSHPEHGWHWTKAEERAIRTYAAAAMAAERERLCAWLEIQRNGIPATGAEFAAAIRGEQK